MAANLIYIGTDCSGGINQNPDRMQHHQCADARNVWNRGGTVVQRPGVAGLGTLVQNTGVKTQAPADTIVLYEDTTLADPGVFYYQAIIDISNGLARTAAQNGWRWYWGTSNVIPTVTTRRFAAIRVGTLGPNGPGSTADHANRVAAQPEYWNGSAWVYLPGILLDNTWYAGCTTQGTEHFYQIPHLESFDNGGDYYFVPPGDWAQSTITADAAGTPTAYTRYFLRFTLLSQTGTQLDADVRVRVISSRTTDTIPKGYFAARFPTKVRYLSVMQDPASTGLINFGNAATVDQHDTYLTENVARVPSQLPAVMALVPQFEEAFIAYGGRITIHRAEPSGEDDIFAAVETRDFAIGPGAPWDRDSIPLQGDFPKANLIAFFRNRLWAVDENQNLVWSAAAPFHKVWPGSALEPLPEGDSSPATGLVPLHEDMTIYKRDSIWKAVFRDVDAFGVPRFIPKKMVTGIGATAHATIQTVRGRHVFLGDDGLYEYNGIAAEKVTIDPQTGVDRLKDFINSVVPGRRPYASSAHWKKEKVYLLSLSVDGATTNSTTLVWDYDENTFWIWTGFTAEMWCVAEDQMDNEVLYFINEYGHIFQLGVSDHDHGSAIDSSVVTRRLGYKDGVRKTLTNVSLTSDNAANTLAVQVLPNSRPQARVTARTATFKGVTEESYGVKAMGGAMDWVSERTRELSVNSKADHCQLRIAGHGRGGPFKLTRVEAGFLPHKKQ
jgi:hypothetical protein